MAAQNPQASRRILVADDDPAILRLVTAIVEKEGYTVVPARDGREAYKLLQDDSDFIAGISSRKPVAIYRPRSAGAEAVRALAEELEARISPRKAACRRIR